MSALGGRRPLPRSQNMSPEDDAAYDDYMDRLVASSRPIDAEESARLRRLLVPARAVGGDTR